MPKHIFLRARSARLAGAGLALALSVACAIPVKAAQAGASVWTLASDRANRTCQLTLQFDAAGAAGELAMPAGCRRAIPILRQARSWTMGETGQINLNDPAGQALLTFSRQPDGEWRAQGPDGAGFGLGPAATLPAEAVQTAGAPALDAIPPEGAVALLQDLRTAPSADMPVVRVAASQSSPKSGGEAREIGGRYAVMRGERDTGCMVTLDPDSRGPKGGFRARLAPACRDQGIIVFDPLGWHAEKGHLVLTARKGHSISLDKDEGGIWVKMPKDDKALGLKRL